MKKIITKFFILSVLILSLSGVLLPRAFADTGSGTGTDAEKEYVIPVIPKPRTLPGPEGSDNRKTLTETILPNYAVGTIGFVGALSLIFLIIGGLRFTMAYGKEESVENAKKQVIYALVGLVIALMSYTIVSIISNIELKSDETKTIQENSPAPPAPKPN